MKKFIACLALLYSGLVFASPSNPPVYWSKDSAGNSTAKFLTQTVTFPSGGMSTSGTTTFAEGKFIKRALDTPGAPTCTPAAGGAIPDGTVYYVIVALDWLSGETIKGTQSAACVAGGGNNTMNLSWSAVNGAWKYKIFRTTTSGTYGASSLIATSSVQTTTYSDAAAAPGAGTPLTASTASLWLISTAGVFSFMHNASFYGPVALGGASPTTTYNLNILSAPTTTAAMIYSKQTPSHTSGSSAKYWYGYQMDGRPIVSTGASNTGTSVALIGDVLRNQDTASTDDGGTIAGIYGTSIQVGNYSTNKTAAPVVTNVTAFRAIPYINTGTITTYYGLFLGNKNSITNTVIWSAANLGSNKYVYPSGGLGSWYYFTTSCDATGDPEPNWAAHVTQGESWVGADGCTYVTTIVPAITNYYGVYQQDATALNHFYGHTSVGNQTPIGGRLLLLNESSGGSTLTGTEQAALQTSPWISSAATSGMSTKISLNLNSGFALTAGYGIYVAKPFLNTGSIVTYSSVHIEADNNAGGTTKYGLYIGNQSAAGTNYSIFQTGTGGSNVLNAATRIGAATAPTSGIELDLTGDFQMSGDFIVSTSGSPASGAACTAGKIIWDASYIYVCTASAAWKRAALTGGY